MDPFLRWAGSKRALLSKLRGYWNPNTSRYIEPFCGSACLFFDVEPRKAILGDINRELITTYRVLREHPQKIANRIKAMGFNQRTYAALRKCDPHKLSGLDRAVRFIYLNRLCFNGIYRTNLKGQFNVPYAKPKKRTRFDSRILKNASKILQNATFVRGDFEATLKKAKHGDFVYLDPPYAIRSRRIFSEYHPETFTIGDLERLRQALRRLDKKGVVFVISYADSAEGRKLLADWNPRRIRTRRNVAGFADHRRAAYEMLASNVEQQK